jgi:phosphatidylinositol glycan class C protein
LAIWLCIANILFNDYSFFSKKRFKLVISTNLALSAAIVLASRLPTTSSVFCFVLFSVQLFGLLPLFATWVRETSPQGHWALLGTLLSITDVSLFVFYGPSAMGVWIVVQLSVALAFPGWFLGLQKYKNEIQGPWDPARPVIGPH